MSEFVFTVTNSNTSEKRKFIQFRHTKEGPVTGNWWGLFIGPVYFELEVWHRRGHE